MSKSSSNFFYLPQCIFLPCPRIFGCVQSDDLAFAAMNEFYSSKPHRNCKSPLDKGNPAYYGTNSMKCVKCPSL